MIYKGFSPPAESQNDSLIVSCHSLHLKLKKIKHIDRLENIEMNLWAYMDWTQNCQRLYYSIKSLCHASNNIKSWNLFYWMNFSNRKNESIFAYAYIMGARTVKSKPVVVFWLAKPVAVVWLVGLVEQCEW